jgi:hypothetical protein
MTTQWSFLQSHNSIGLVVSDRRFSRFQPIGTRYWPWQPCWISDLHQKQKSDRGPSNEHLWQVWLKSVQRLQRRRVKCEKLTDGRRMLTHDISSHGLWPGELKKKKQKSKKTKQKQICMLFLSGYLKKCVVFKIFLDIFKPYGRTECINFLRWDLLLAYKSYDLLLQIYVLFQLDLYALKI